jgi:hypothetical protein
MSMYVSFPASRLDAFSLAFPQKALPLFCVCIVYRDTMEKDNIYQIG